MPCFAAFLARARAHIYAHTNEISIYIYIIYYFRNKKEGKKGTQAREERTGKVRKKELKERETKNEQDKQQKKNAKVIESNNQRRKTKNAQSVNNKSVATLRAKVDRIFFAAKQNTPCNQTTWHRHRAPAKMANMPTRYSGNHGACIK